MEAAREFEKTTALILAAEKWSSQYKRDKDTFAKLVKAEAKINRVMLEYFRDLAKRMPEHINWNLYNQKLQEVQAAATDALQVNVIVEDLPDTEDGTIMKVLYDPIASATQAGLQAGQKIYKTPLGDSGITEAVHRLANSRIAYLVGKRIDNLGNIIDNPNSDYSITEATRDLIRGAIRTSLNLGEDQEEATTRMQSVIKDPERASKIAGTEAVNAYQGGLADYAKTTGAIGKEWQAIDGACPTCQANVDAGVIGINDTFPSGDSEPAAHPWDRCGVRYVYSDEEN